MPKHLVLPLHRLLLLICCAACATALVVVLPRQLQAGPDKSPYVIGAVFDITGPASPLGTPEANTARMLADEINARGGIDGHPVKLVVYDNASDESKSVMAIKKLIEADKALVIIGPSQTGTTLAAAATVEEAKVPMISCGSGIKIVEPTKPWIFKTAQSDVYAVAKVLEYAKEHKWKKIAVISVANAFGDSGKQQLKAQAPAAGITIVANESFGDKDTDMTAALLHLRGSGAQAIVCWGTNPGPAIVAKNMKMLGIKIPLIMSHGIANRKFLELAGPAAEGLVFPCGKMIVAKDIPDADPQKKVLLSYAASYKKRYNAEADTFGGHAYDAFHLACAALDKVGPNRQAIRDELERMRFVGVSGVFQFTPNDHNGLKKDAYVMVRIKNGAWTIAK